MKKLIYITVVLVAVWILFQNSEPYAKATKVLTDYFGQLWDGLTKGKVATNV